MPAQTQVPAWEGDALDRKPTGDYLYRLLLQTYKTYHEGKKNGSLCVALDADWGAGKSFFIERWSKDIKHLHHPVVEFDAWVNDLADDPLLGFMAELQKALKPWIASLPVKSAVKTKATRFYAKVLKQAPKAVLPALMVVGKGLLKKVSGINTEDLLETFADGIGADELDATKDISKEALSEFLKVAMEAHSDRQEAITALKESLEDMFSYLGQQPEVNLPMFIFVDELDRCRPDYAIRLLEGVKHLFDAEGICFVFSTNLTQLSESAKAVYGPGFDGYKYLQRFFSMEYRLPEPNNVQYAKKLSGEMRFLSTRSKVASAFQIEGDSQIESISRAFSFVSELFSLDLRSQDRVYRLSEAACAGFLEDQTIHYAFIFFLAAAYIKGPKFFLQTSPKSASFPEFLKTLVPVKFIYKGHALSGKHVSKEVHVSEIFTIYFQASRQFEQELSRQQSALTLDTVYPETLKNLLPDNSRPHPASSTSMSSLNDYHRLVATAGQLNI